ncbi:MAG: O-antigen ligase family protein [Acidimicrobiales bacterium]
MAPLAVSPLESAIVVAFLVTAAVNFNPYPAALATALLALVALPRALRERQTRPVLILAATYGYWVVSCFGIAGLALGQVFNINFLRWDGRVFTYYLPFFYFATRRMSVSTASRILRIMITTAAVIVAVALLQWIAPFHIPGVPDLIRRGASEDLSVPFFYGLQIAHNAAGTYYGILALVVVTAMTNTELSTWSRRRWMITSLLVFAGFAMALSREAVVGFVAGLSYWVLSIGTFTVRRYVSRILVVVPLVVILATVNPGLLSRWTQIKPTNYNVAYRQTQQAASIRLWLRTPIVGIGFGRWNDLRAEYGDVSHARLQGVPWFIEVARPAVAVSNDDSPHNSYVLFLAEDGLIGFVLVLAFWFSMLRYLRRARWLRSRGGAGRYLLLAAEACIFFVLADSFFGHGMAAPAIGLPVCTVCGCAIAVARSTLEGDDVEGERRAGEPPRAATGVVRLRTREAHLRAGDEAVDRQPLGLRP